MPITTEAAAGQPASPWRTALVCFLPFAVGYFVSFIFRTINAVAGPDIAAELDLDAARLGFVTSAYFLAFAVMQLPVGMALDRFGPRRVEASLLLVAAIAPSEMRSRVRSSPRCSTRVASSPCPRRRGRRRRGTGG